MIASSHRIVRASLSILLAATTVVASAPATVLAVDVDPPVAFFVETSYLPTYDHASLWVWEVIDPTSIPDPGDFQVYIDNSPIPEPATDVDFVYQGLVGSELLTSFGLHQGTAFLEVRWTTPVANGTPIYIDYTPGAHPIRDLAGNELAPMVQAEVFPLPVEEFLAVVPFVDEGAGPDTLLLFFGQPLASATPALTEFELEIAGLPVGNPTAIARRFPHLGATFLYLTLPQTVAPGESVHVAYTPGTLEDRFGDPFPAFDVDAFVSLSTSPTRQTDPGTDVEVVPADDTTGAQLATITFDSVTGSGSTTLTTTETAPPLPAGFTVGDPPTYYTIETTATFTGSARVCIRYGAADYTDPNALVLLHFESAAWQPAANQSIDLGTQTICGDVTSFSPFAVAQGPFSFEGFFSPVDNPPTINAVAAGRVIPVKFSLGGDQGLAVFAAGSPSSRQVACPSEAPIDAIEETVATSGPSLTYSAGTDRYQFNWKTEKSWAGTCRELVLRFADGSAAHTALFSFKQ